VVTKLGLIGLSEGNGHPYSWGAIINGFQDEAMKQANWDVIYQYLRIRDASEFGFADVSITHIWTQDYSISENLSKAINNPMIVDHYLDMIGEVDAVIIARDDYEQHMTMAKPFLEAGIKVLIDKPLTLSIDELLAFKPYLYQGQLMSVAGLRFAKELDEIRGQISQFGELKYIQTAIVMDWEKYGIHMIDAVLGMINEVPQSIEYVQSTAGLYVIAFRSGLVWTVNMLGHTAKTFSIEVWGDKQRKQVEITDNFSMFRRLLYRFVKLVQDERQLISPEQMMMSIALLIGGKQSKDENRKVDMQGIYEKLGIVGGNDNELYE